MTAVLLTLVLTVAPTASVDVLPRHVRPGDAFLVRVRDARGTRAGAPASLPEGTAAGRRLAFFPIRGGAAAFGGLPVETPPGPLSIRVTVSGEVREAALAVREAGFARRELHVEGRFVEPPDPSLQARIDDDRAAFARAFAQDDESPLFTAPFALPRRARITAGYGEERTFNAVRPSQHYGMDLAGKVGAPVAASNAGRVVLVRDCWASGRTVILWHGGGVYTTYFHLSRVTVREGQRVARGQRIGLVGRTGRVSGPHLHWGVRVGDLYVDPASMLRLPVTAVQPPRRR